MNICTDCDHPAVRGGRCDDCATEVEESPRWSVRQDAATTVHERAAQCGHAVPSHGGRQRKACDACTPAPVKRQARARAQCAQCSVEFLPSQRSQRFCSQACWGKSRRSARACSVSECNNPHRAQGLCSTHYNRTFQVGSQKRCPGDPDRRRRQLRAKSQRRRAAARAVDAELVDRDRVGDRDGWKCGICRRRVSRSLAYPHQRSPSLDHVVPLSEGGPHTYANCRISHLACNLARGNRGGGEQLALIG